MLRGNVFSDRKGDCAEGATTDREVLNGVSWSLSGHRSRAALPRRPYGVDAGPSPMSGDVCSARPHPAANDENSCPLFLRD